MDTLSYKTRSINKENADKKWWLVDAEGQTLGRLSSQIATLLRGKHKTNFIVLTHERGFLGRF